MFSSVLRIITSYPGFYRTLPSDMKDPRSGMKSCWLGLQWSPCCFVLCAMHCFVSYTTPMMKAVFPILAYFSLLHLCVLGLQWSPCVSCYVSSIVSCNIPLRWKQFSPSYVAYFSSLSKGSWVLSDARRPEVAFLGSGFAPNFWNYGLYKSIAKTLTNSVTSGQIKREKALLSFHVLRSRWERLLFKVPYC